MYKKLAEITNFSENQIRTVISLTEEGYTIPFIARYRKEQTSYLNEIDIKAILEGYEKLVKLDNRRDEIIGILIERQLLNPKIKLLLEEADKISTLEELYKPYKKKQKTKAMIARENGLEEVADQLRYFKQKRDGDFSRFIGNKYSNKTEIINDALHIIIEDISNNQYLRKALIDIYKQKAVIIVERVKAEQVDAEKIYENYYNFRKPIKYLESFQILAINRGIKEKVLTASLELDIDINYKIERILRINPNLAYYQELIQASKKAYSSNLKPSLYREIMNELTDQAENRSIEVFANNLKSLLLRKPFKAKSVMGIDPGFRTGCKIAVIDETGNYLAKDVIFPVPPQNKVKESKEILLNLIQKFKVDVIAIGDGTASYETTQVVAELIHDHNLPTRFTIISESGASVYSASEIAQEEFPNLDLTIRSAISIARRVLSFLDEMIKVPPESIGVGMYQHDINAKKLSEALAFEVTSLVHHVGVDLNTASPYLLKFVSGISPSVAKNIVEYRKELGRFTSRKELMKVKGFGPKAFELASGFCRVSNSKNPLDNTIIHPDDYPKAYKLLASLGFKQKITDISYRELRSIFHKVPKQNLTCPGLSKHDIDFIYSAIAERDIDPRESLPSVKLENKLPSIEDFHVGSHWQGQVKNVTDFGLFVSLGGKTDGLVHVSNFNSKNEMFKKYPPGQLIEVTVKNLDIEKNRIQLILTKE